MNRFLMALVLASAASSAPAATVCRLATSGGFSFGTYDVFSAAATDTLLNLDVVCERDGGPQQITMVMRLDGGSHGAALNSRRMLHTAGSGDVLLYGLFRDAARSSSWGSSVGVDTVARTLTVPNKSSATTTFTIFARIPAQQDVTAGAYADAVVVTIDY